MLYYLLYIICSSILFPQSINGLSSKVEILDFRSKEHIRYDRIICGEIIEESNIIIELEEDLECEESGIRFFYVSNVEFHGNGHLITGQDENNQGFGISVSNSNNIIINNIHLSQFEVGILISSSELLQLLDISCSNIEHGAVDMSFSNEVLVEEIDIFFGSHSGISIHESNNITIQNALVSGCGTSGLTILNSSNVGIYNCSINANSEIGIGIRSNSNHVEVAYTDISDNGIYQAFVWDASSNISLHHNVFQNGGEEGSAVYCLEVVGGEIYSNQFLDNVHSDLWINSASDGLYIYDNFFSNPNLLDHGDNNWNIDIQDRTNIIGGPLTTGNYYRWWDDWMDVNADGISEEVYYIPGLNNSQDHFPLTCHFNASSICDSNNYIIFDSCDPPEVIFYQECNYTCYSGGCLDVFGDINLDNQLNIIDIIVLVSIIIEPDILPSEAQLILADPNNDNNINILDIMIIINAILFP